MSGERPSGATRATAGHGTTSATSASEFANGARFDFRAPSRHGLVASVPQHGSLLSDIAPASDGKLLALVLALAAAIGGTLVVLNGVGRRPRVRDWRRHVVASMRGR